MRKWLFDNIIFIIMFSLLSFVTKKFCIRKNYVQRQIMLRKVVEYKKNNCDLRGKRFQYLSIIYAILNWHFPLRYWSDELKVARLIFSNVHSICILEDEGFFKKLLTWG